MDSPISVCTAGKYPALRIRAEAEKKHRDRAATDRARVRGVPVRGTEADRHGLVFGIYGENDKPLSTKRASRYICSHRQGGEASSSTRPQTATRRLTTCGVAFGSRWAKRVMPAVLKDLMRHSSSSRLRWRTTLTNRPTTWATCCDWR